MVMGKLAAESRSPVLENLFYPRPSISLQADKEMSSREISPALLGYAVSEVKEALL